MHEWAGLPAGPLSVLMLCSVLIAACREDNAVIREPELITVDAPFDYPKDMWSDGVEGETVVMVRVTEMGAVDSVYVVESSGVAAFDSAAVTGARDLRFVPGRRDDVRTTMWARLPVRFHVNDTIPPLGATP